jgi:hypothetical protein
MSQRPAGSLTVYVNDYTKWSGIGGRFCDVLYR